MWEMTVEARTEQINPVTDFINAILAELGCSVRTRIQIDVAVDELFSNIARYAYAPETGPVTVRVDAEGNPAQVSITFTDHGKPFNPLKAEIPDTTALSAGERPIGGLGLFMVRKSMDDISYRNQDGQNILTIRKRI